MQELDLTLPSGLRVAVRRLGAGAPASSDRFRGERFSHGRLYRSLEDARLAVERRDGGEAFTARDLDGLALPDFHALRDAAQRVGAVAPGSKPALCRNCDADLTAGLSGEPPVDLEHWYVEEVPAVDPRPVPLSDRGRTIRIAPTTAGEARPFFRATASRRFTLTGEVVRAMGITELGELTDPEDIREALQEASEDEWAAVLEVYEQVAYSPKSYFPVLCEHCGALHDAPAPGDREVDGPDEAETDAPGRARASGASADWGARGRPAFPTEDEFAALALEIGAAVYRDQGVRNIELEVVAGVADVDGSGEPLLGSYQPGADGDPGALTQLPFLIRVYYRTFARMYEDEPYDVAAELRETIAHEVEHHLHYLRGYDPMDEAERAEAMDELERTYGKRAFRRAQVADAAAFGKRVGWLLLGTLIVLGAMVAFLRLTGRL